MENDKDNLFEINPVKNYEAPNLPTLQGVRGDSEFLKKLPSRWRKNAAVVTCIGLMGTMTISGCGLLFDRHPPHFGGAGGAPIYVARPTEQDIPRPTADDMWMHYGGEGGAPVYVAYLSEQEAFGIIREQLEAAGLNFSAAPPEYTASVWDQNIGLDLFDEEKGVAVAFSDRELVTWPGRDFSRLAAEEFAQQTDIAVGVFFNPKVDDWLGEEDAKEELIAQAQEFISFLKVEGILTVELPTPFSPVDLELRLHNGGSAGAPDYVVHLTEQEAFGIIRAQLEAAGLSFGAAPPDYTYEGRNPIGLDLFDEDKGVAIANISWEDSNQRFSATGAWFAEAVSDNFREQTDNISVGVFYNPGEIIGVGTLPWDVEHEPLEPNPEAEENARAILEERLAAQVQEFVAWLQSEGVL